MLAYREKTRRIIGENVVAMKTARRDFIRAGFGAAGAMAAAAVVQYAGGTPQQAADAAAIAFQNTMGSVCDLVQGLCEIPCHTRNAVAASNAFICADLILGGYHNPICLDETIDAVFQTGQMLPQELRCTSLGGIAQCPSALKIKKDSEAT